MKEKTFIAGYAGDKYVIDNIVKQLLHTVVFLKYAELFQKKALQQYFQNFVRIF